MDVVLSGMDEGLFIEQSFARYMFPEIKLRSRKFKNFYEVYFINRESFNSNITEL